MKKLHVKLEDSINAVNIQFEKVKEKNIQLNKKLDGVRNLQIKLSKTHEQLTIAK